LWHLTPTLSIAHFPGDGLFISARIHSIQETARIVGENI
jgi:hypothetical protein